jgi:branched-chain amino acid transport system ATP-binding protein
VAELLLDVKSVTKRFGGLTATEDVSFSIGVSEIVGLIGPNGAGKTTLFNCIAGYFPPTKGEIYLRGERIDGLPSEAVAKRRIGRTFQIVRTFGSMTALENVMVGALLRHRRVGDARTRAIECLEFVGLADRMSVDAAFMTVAEQRRLQVARALATEPLLILLDEVMAGLNPFEIQEAIGLMKRIKALGIASLIIEHVMEGVMPIADRIVVLDYGKKIAEGTPKKISEDAAVIAAYLGS